MRLEPIDRPRSLLVRLFYRLSRWRLGRVVSAASVIYARMPRLLRPQLRMLLLERRLSLPARLRHLVSVHVSMLNGCGFCSDLHGRMAVEEGVELELLRRLPSFRTDPAFTAAERIALEWAESMILHRGDEGAFAALREAFDERAVVELTWLVAFTGYLNTMGVALGMESDGLCALPPPRRKLRPVA